MSDIESSDRSAGNPGDGPKEPEDLIPALDLVIAHARERNIRVVNALCFVSLLQSIGRINPQSMVATDSSNQLHFAAETSQPVAYLPCDILIDSQRLLEVPIHPFAKAQLGHVFTDTGPMPAAFWSDNEALARVAIAELADALGLATKHVLGCYTASRCISRTGVRTAYNNLWAPRARRSFQNQVLTSMVSLLSQAHDSETRSLEQACQTLLTERSSLLDRPPAELTDHYMERIEQGFA